MTKRRSKTRDKLLSIPKEEMDKLGLEIERLAREEMSFVVNMYLNKYRNSTADTFGWTEDDLLQHIKIIMWKGIATYDESKGIKLTTYLSTCLYYQMGNLSKTIQNDKNSKSKLYCPETLYDSEYTSINTNSEDWTRYSQSFKALMGNMTTLESKVLVEHLIDGLSITKMEKKLKKKRPVLVATIKRLKEKIKFHLGEIDDKDRLH